MKKKIVSGKVLAVSGLCLACVAILIGVLVWRSTPNPEFTPDDNHSVVTPSTWEEPEGDNKGSRPASTPTPEQTDTASDADTHAKDNYKVVSEDEDEVVIDMTPPAHQSEAPKPPAAPEGQTATPDNEIPEEPADGGACIPETPKEKETEKPGQVYDPVFGWTDIADASGQEADSNGDPNKMIGTMD